MAFEFKAAPLQDGFGSLTIQFVQFFYLVNFPRTFSAGDFEGAVVLCPSRGHKTLLTLTTSKEEFKGKPVTRKQIEVFADSGDGKPKALSLSGLKTTGPGSNHLATSKQLFERDMPMQPGLVSHPEISPELNARFVLADGSLHEHPPQRPNADVDWYFVRPGQQARKRRLTDRLDYQLPFRVGHKYWLVISNGIKIEADFPLGSGVNTLLAFNEDTAERKESFPKGSYVLTGYEDLHDSVLVLGAADVGKMRGNILADDVRLRFRGAAEPICGGEQGDPDPPEDPPDPPNP